MKESGKKSKSKNNKNKKTFAGAGFPMTGVDVEQLERLLDFMATHGLEEFEYEHGGLHIRLRKASAIPAVVAATLSSVTGETARPVASTQSVSSEGPAAERSSEAVGAASQAEELHIVKSPIVGTFYTAASPEAAPFVKVGDTIQEGKVVCIVEAMKLMNEIEADAAGEVVRILVENGQPVEYGQPLFAIRPAKKKK